MARKAERPVDVARRLVDDWFESLLETNCAFEAGSIYQVDMEGAFTEVQKAVKRADREQHPERKLSADDEAVEDEMHAKEAGYLIGVQVGLRLRR